MDMQEGLICSITKQKAAFEERCQDYSIDEFAAREEEMKASTDLNAEELSLKLSPAAQSLLQSRQNLSKGIFGGFLVALLCAVAWASITVASGYQTGFMAVGLGLAVGHAVAYFGQGIEPAFRFVGAILALLGCVLGNTFSLIGFAAEDIGTSIWEVIAFIDISALPQALIDFTEPMDLLFYGIALFEGYKFSVKQLSADHLVKLEGQARTYHPNKS